MDDSITIIDVSTTDCLKTITSKRLRAQIMEICRPPENRYSYLKWYPPTQIKVEKIEGRYFLTILKTAEVPE